MQAGLPLLRCSTAAAASSAAALKRRHKLSSSTAMDDGKEVPPAPAAGGLAERIMPHLLNMYVRSYHWPATSCSWLSALL
jgi:hypothetical protein